MCQSQAAAYLQADGWAEKLSGDASPGRRWRLVVTAGMPGSDLWLLQLVLCCTCYS